jgi:uncharacterized membrane protein
MVGSKTEETAQSVVEATKPSAQKVHQKTRRASGRAKSQSGKQQTSVQVPATPAPGEPSN